MKKFDGENSINNLINETMLNMKSLTNSSTIFGEPTILPDGSTVIPVSKTTIGFVIGGGEYSDLSSRRVGVHYPMAGGSGGGISISPIGFLVSTANEIKFISSVNAAMMEKLIDKISKITSFLKEKSKK